MANFVLLVIEDLLCCLINVQLLNALNNTNYKNVKLLLMLITVNELQTVQSNCFLFKVHSYPDLNSFCYTYGVAWVSKLVHGSCLLGQACLPKHTRSALSLGSCLFPSSWLRRGTQWGAGEEYDLQTET